MVKKNTMFRWGKTKKTPIFVRFGPSDPHGRLSVWNPWEVGTEALSSLGSRGIEALSASKQQAVQAAQAVTHSMLGNLTGHTFCQKVSGSVDVFLCVYTLCCV